MNSNHSPARNLFFITFLALFSELLFIRWLSSEIRLFAYYNNLILLSALLGWGAGLILEKRQSYQRVIKIFPPLVFILVGFVLLTGSYFIPPLGVESNFIWNGLSRVENPFGLLSYILIILLLIINTFIFVVLGHEVGYWFKQLKSLHAYSVDILGSLCGVVAFTFISALSLGPLVWFSTLFFFFLFYVFSTKLFEKREFWANLIIIAIIIIAIFIFGLQDSMQRKIFWSPYYKIQVQDLDIDGTLVGENILVNRDSHQQMLDLSGKINHIFLNERKKFYELPYSFFSNPPEKVLVLGAGAGNDVAAALRSGAKNVVAVEIDPVIAEIGKSHPERPYDSKKVQIIVDDARAYLERDQSVYDLITFGFLDSHRLFSSMSSIRLENYLYTVENIKNVKEHLRSGGILAVAYTVHEQWIADRIFSLLEKTFKQKPLVYQGSQYAWGTIFFVRNGEPLLPSSPPISEEEFRAVVLSATTGHTWAYADISGFLSTELFNSSVKIPSDDWPHLFLRNPSIPINYLSVLLILFAFSLVLVLFQIPKFVLGSAENWNFFFLGAGFALLETKGITGLAILLGSTWVTNSVVIGSIFVMILFANFLVTKNIQLRPFIFYIGLVGVLLFSFYFSFTHLFSYNYPTRAVLAGVEVGLPIFFSAFLFATYFRNVADSTTALGANLIGAMFGGLLEYTSLIFGQKILFLIAIIFYFLSFMFYLKINKKFPWTLSRGMFLKRISFKTIK